MRESDLLQRIAEATRTMTRRWSQVLLGPGDDCAAVQVRNVAGSGRAAAAAGSTDGGVALLTVDQVVEGCHFTPGTPVDLIARKAVARSISDIAAMGGTPTWTLAAGVLPEGFAHAADLTDGLHRWGEHWRAPVVGGDIAMSPRGTPLVLAVTAGGEPHPRRGVVRRAGACPGDDVWVSGRFGGSFAEGWHLSFEPRLREAAALCDRLGERLHAMIDVSDGLGRDAGRIAEAGGVRIEIDGAAVPRRAGASVMSALQDGEDYELCFVVEAGAMKGIDQIEGTMLTRIGRVVEGRGCVVRLAEGDVDARDMGWDHGCGAAGTPCPGFRA